MNPKRIPKRCYNGSSTKNRKVQQTADNFRTDDTLKILERKIDAGASHIGLVIADIFIFLTKSAAMLPDMELHTKLLNLTVDDSGILAHITHPDCRDCCDFGDEPDDADDDNNYDEEGLLYDGD